MKESFVFFETWADAIRQMPDKERLQVYDAIMAYGIYGEKTEIGGLAQMALNLVFNDIDDCKNKRKQKAEKARESANKRWQKANADECERIQTDANAYERKQTDATQCYNVNVNVNGNVNDNVNGELFIADKSAKTKTAKQQKKIYGEYQNVKLTDDEAAKLHEEFGDDAIGIVDFLSSYRAEKGYKNKSDYLSIKRWVANAYFEQLNKTKNGNFNNPRSADYIPTERIVAAGFAMAKAGM